MLDDHAFIRFSRQIMLDEVGEVGQATLAKLRVLQIGLGGLGCAAAQALLAAGVGVVVAADDDEVELSNLPRQGLYRLQDVGRSKSEAAHAALSEERAAGRLRTHCVRVDALWLAREVPLVDVVLDCSDNMPTRQAVNAACVAAGKPLVSAAVAGWRGQLMSFVPGGGCYHCQFAASQHDEAGSCRTLGIISPLPALAGHWQATQALRIGLQRAADRTGLAACATMVRCDLWQGQWQVLQPASDQGCPVCGGGQQWGR